MRDKTTSICTPDVQESVSVAPLLALVGLSAHGAWSRNKTFAHWSYYYTDKNLLLIFQGN